MRKKQLFVLQHLLHWPGAYVPNAVPLLAPVQLPQQHLHRLSPAEVPEAVRRREHVPRRDERAAAAVAHPRGSAVPAAPRISYQRHEGEGVGAGVAAADDEVVVRELAVAAAGPQAREGGRGRETRATGAGSCCRCGPLHPRASAGAVRPGPLHVVAPAVRPGGAPGRPVVGRGPGKGAGAERPAVVLEGELARSAEGDVAAVPPGLCFQKDNSATEEILARLRRRNQLPSCK